MSIIFGSASFITLRKKYERISDFYVPKIILLDRNQELKDELSYLDSLIQLAPAEKQRDWIGRLINKDDNQHMGAWFEIMLFDWLRQIGTVHVEPELNGNRPDFAINIKGYQIPIEARAIVLDEKEKTERIADAELTAMLQAIKRPFAVSIKLYKRTNLPINFSALQAQVEQWLENNPDEIFEYQDNRSNRVRLSAQHWPTLQSVGVMGPVRSFWANPLVLQRPLREKASQHKALRQAGHPYVIAILLESYRLSAAEVVEAWFGKEVVLVDIVNNTVVDEHLDDSGLHFSGPTIQHASVSGTLIFRIDYIREKNRRCLRGWYVQNPYANQPLPTNIFPVESSFIVKTATSSTYQMGWQSSEMDVSSE